MKWIAQEAKLVVFNKWKDKKKKGQKKTKNGHQGKKEGPKLPMHQKLKLYANNERGINTIAKRQQLAASWQEEKIDVAMMGETQKNTGGMEQGTSWNNEYITFFSTGIHPKIREEQEKKRLQTWDRQARKRKRKNRNRAEPIAKPQPKQQRLDKVKMRKEKVAQEEQEKNGKGRKAKGQERDPHVETKTMKMQVWP